MNASYTKPNSYDVLLMLKDEILRSLRSLMPATVTAVNAPSGAAGTPQPPLTVDVQIAALQQRPTGEYLKYPPLSKVPAISLYGGGAFLQFPIKVGDQCLVFFADRCMASWKQTGSPQPLPNPRMHDLSDGFALIGVASPLQLMTLLSSTEAGLATPLAKVAIDTLTNKISIANVSGSLLTVVSGLVTAMENLNAPSGDNSLIGVLAQLVAILAIATAGGSPFDAPTIAALGTITTKLASLSTTAGTTLGASSTAAAGLLQ